MTPVLARGLAGLLVFVASTVIAVPGALADPGAVDTGFGTNGATLSQFSSAASTMQTTGASSEVIAPNGDIYVAGETDDASSQTALYLARYLPGGAPDTGFGVGGVSIQQIGQGTTKRSGGTVTGVGQRIALTASGDVVVPTSASDTAGKDQVAVAEFTPSGALDASFAAGSPTPGVYYDDSASSSVLGTAGATAAVVQGDGKIVFSANARPAGGPEAFVRRLNADGTVDTGFASGGTYTAPAGTAGSPTMIEDLILNSSGNMVFTGRTPEAGDFQEIMLGELGSNGTVTSGFPKLVQTSSATPVRASGGDTLIEAADGDYIVGGDSATADVGSSLATAWIAVAFTPSGSLDTTFGPSRNGVAELLDGGAEPSSIAQQADGRLVFTGMAQLGFAVVRTLVNGVLDTSFGSGGVASVAFDGLSTGSSLAIAGDGQLVVSGFTVAELATSTSLVLDSSALLTKIVLDTPPSLVISAGPAVAGQPVSLSATTLSDTSGTSIKWDLGSGSFTDATGATVSKTFASAGTYTVRAQATDADGVSSTATQTVTVAAAPPTQTITVTAPPVLPPGACTGSAQPTVSVTAKIISPHGLLLAGTAAADCPSQVHSVAIAVARVTGKKCSFLSSHHRWGKRGSCTPTTYLPATGTYSWGFAVKLKLGRGTYRVWPRATDDHGVSTATSPLTLKVR